MRRLLSGLLLATGCASAGRDTVGGHPDGGFAHPDGQAKVYLDAPMALPDAPPGQQTVTLSQTTSPTIAANASIACPAPTLGTAANNYYRVFDLAAMGIHSAFHVSQVSFQVEDCESGSSTCTNVAVRVGTYSGTPDVTLSTANMTVLASNATVSVPLVIESTNSTPGGTVNAPISATIPNGQKLLVEVDAPDGFLTYQFYMGANAGGESGFGYLLAPDCGYTSPTNISTISTSAPVVDLLLTVTGTY